jgi:hypothetical protein
VGRPRTCTATWVVDGEVALVGRRDDVGLLDGRIAAPVQDAPWSTDGFVVGLPPAEPALSLLTVHDSTIGLATAEDPCDRMLVRAL